ncbi:MAG: carbohydrate-binding family 9-like protein [Candidatus Krumholzibacteriota bacterium]|nr:carbohydrate-binding family 9-like protein [Candidatus Krumholzibacteriota bacterium]
MKKSDEVFPEPAIDFDPPRYICHRTFEKIIIDGKPSEKSWENPRWTSYFVNIDGSTERAPRYSTRAKMLWNGEYLFIAAEMDEPQVWAKLEERDAAVFQDNDFEVFIDPDGDTHEYYELEINARGTVWDLLLLKPYRDGGPAVNAWDIRGLRTAVYVDGTLNDPRDTDKGWSVEMAIPWEVLGECAHRNVPPDENDIWRVNFSRVEWPVQVVDGRYVKQTDAETGRALPESNWSWAPQGIANMHYPEMWGLVKFTNTDQSYGGTSFIAGAEEPAWWALRRLYYRQRTHYLQYGAYTEEIDRLQVPAPELLGFKWPPRIEVTSNLYEICLESERGGRKLFIAQDGDVWSEGEE